MIKCLKLKFTCLGDEEADTSKDISSRSRDDTSVLIFVTLSDWCHSHTEHSRFLIISNEGSVGRTVLWCLYHYPAKLIYLSSAPVLCVFFVLKVILTRHLYRPCLLLLPPLELKAEVIPLHAVLSTKTNRKLDLQNPKPFNITC